MKRIFPILTLMLLLSFLSTSAQPTGNKLVNKPVQLEKPVIDYSKKYLPPNGKEGGETIATAIEIAALPYYDTGNTCDNVNDYDEACPYTESYAPDVVYKFTPLTDAGIIITLCNDATAYDTKLYVYENSYTPGSPYACNDDYCTTILSSYVSEIQTMVTGGNTYYIIIDGYGGACGNYELKIYEIETCFDCLTCSTPEGEGDIPDYGTDNFNGGCNTPPLYPFSPIQLNQVICGRSNTYYFGEGSNYRDTDWYELTLTESGTLYWSGYAQFDLQLFIIWGNCDNLDFVGTHGGNCNRVTVSASLSPGTYYLWAGPYFYSGMPTGQNYHVIATLNELPPDPFCSECIADEQVIPILYNWSLISSYLEPQDDNVVNIMQPVVEDLVVMLGTSGVYAPAPFNVNTLLNWDVHKGYKIKMLDEYELTFEGCRLADNTLELDAGFHYLPVLTNAGVLIENIFDNPLTDILYIFDLETSDIYWPNGQIFSLTSLIPGKGYLAHFLNDVIIDFPDYLTPSPVPTGTKSTRVDGTNTPWRYSPTGNVCFISISGDAIKNLNADLIGAFDLSGNCVGYTSIGELQGNKLLPIYGDDEFTNGKDGATEGEPITFLAYNGSTKTEESLVAIFDPSMPQSDGSFAMNGQSKITAFMKSTATGSGPVADQVKIYPNPANKEVNIIYPYSGIAVDLAVLTIEGKIVKATTLNNSETRLDIGSLQPGVYVLKFENTDQVIVKRLVVR